MTSSSIEPAAQHGSGVWRALLPCFIGTILLGLLSNGVHHDDDLTHFLMARWTRWFPVYLLNVWGRPGATIPMAAAAWIGDTDTAWHACRILSAVVSAAAAWLAARLAGRLGIGPAWAVALACYAQPMYTLLAGTTLTENFLAMYLIGAVCLYYDGRIRLGSVVFSLALLTRHEAMVLLPVWGLALWAYRASWGRRGTALALSLWAPIAHNVAHFAATGKWPAAVFLNATGSTEYGATGVFGYVPQAMQAMTPTLMGLAILGGVRFARRGHGLMAALPAVFFLTHCAVRALGIFASGGYARFMVAIAPFIAILAVAGLFGQVPQFPTWRHRATDPDAPDPTPATPKTVQDKAIAYRKAIVACQLVTWNLGLIAFSMEHAAGRIPISSGRLVMAIELGCPALMLLLLLAGIAPANSAGRILRRVVGGLFVLLTIGQFAAIVRPLRLQPAQRQVETVVAWLRSERLEARPIYATDPWVSKDMGFVEDPRVHKGRQLLAAMPVGTIVLWDSIYSGSDYHGVKLADLQADAAHYRPLTQFATRPDDPKNVAFYVFEKISPTTLPVERERPYPPSPTAEMEQVFDRYYLVPNR